MQRALKDGEEFGGGSPFEALYEEMEELEAEIHRRLVEIS